MYEQPKKQNIINENQIIEEKKSKFEKIREKAEKYMKRVHQCVMVLSIIITVHYCETHKNEVEKIFENGKEIYKHKDKETNHILNYIAGLDSLSSEERTFFLKKVIKQKFALGKDTLFPAFLTDDFETINTEEQLASFLSNLYKDSSSDKEWMEIQFNRVLPSKHQFNDTLYNILWETEQECGSPKIRWTGGQERNPFKMGNKSGVAHFNGLTNTVYIEPTNKMSTLFAEWSHSKQIHDNYLSTVIGEAESIIRITKDATKSKNLLKSQKKEYKIKGSLEYEAHKIIEPYIRAKFSSIKSKR